MDRTVSLPSQLYERLEQKSQQLHQTPERVVAELVQRYLSESDDRWQAEVLELLSRVHSGTSAFSSAEIEADITSAAAEAKEVRRAHRPA
jgi:predicted DNA-binding protein